MYQHAIIGFVGIYGGRGNQEYRFHREREIRRKRFYDRLGLYRTGTRLFPESAKLRKSAVFTERQEAQGESLTVSYKLRQYGNQIKTIFRHA